MSAPNPSTALARAVIASLVDGGVSALALSPGSRSGALAIAASEHADLETVVFLDERSAAFFALGRAKASGSPAAVVATSGTAVANWFPALIEADMSGTAVVMVSADRPAELRGVGANQTIDQVELFGDKVRFFADIPAPDREDRSGSWRSTVAEALTAARGREGPPGPVHLNVAFREPTVPVSDDGRSRADPYSHDLDGGEPPRSLPSPGAGAPLPDLPYRSRGLVLAGDGDYDRGRLLEVAGLLGWPVLATALSGARSSRTVSSYHHLLAGGTPPGLRPEMTVAVGAIGPSHRLESLAGEAAVRVRVDRWGRVLDPTRTATHLIQGDPVELLERVVPAASPDPEWVESWFAAGQSIREVLDDVLGASKDMTGAGVARALGQVSFGALVAGSSLPIREVDAHLDGGGRVLGNRGASGIDGFVGTALGIASAVPRTVALAGDLSLLHDSNGFLNDGDHDLVVVVIDNGGGGLFDRLPQRRHAPDFERLFIADQGRDFSDLARLHGLAHRRASASGELVSGLANALDEGGRHLIEVKVDRVSDLEMGERLDEAARSALGRIDP